jgi:hypothetical protein
MELMRVNAPFICFPMPAPSSACCRENFAYFLNFDEHELELLGIAREHHAFRVSHKRFIPSVWPEHLFSLMPDEMELVARVRQLTCQRQMQQLVSRITYRKKTYPTVWMAGFRWDKIASTAGNGSSVLLFSSWEWRDNQSSCELDNPWI